MPMRRYASTSRPNGRRLQSATKRSALIHRIAFSLFAGAIALGGPIVGEAQQGVLERADLKTSAADLNELINDLISAATAAETVLGEVKSMEIEDGRKAVDQFFEDMKIKVNETLIRLGPNSVLMDNLEGAKAKMVVLQRWFERQPSDYPDRDQLIMRTAEVIKDYDESADTILSGRKEAQDAVREVTRAIFLRSMTKKVEIAEDSVKVTQRMVTSLQALSDKLTEIAKQEEGIPGISN